MTKFDLNVIGFILLLGVVGGLYRFARESDHRFQPNVTQVTSTSERTSPLSLLEEPRALPELRFVNGDGADLTLADFRGKVVLLNVWATWCVPCRKEMPALARLQVKLGGASFEVVALSIDQGGVEKVRAFYDEVGIHGLNVYLDISGYVVRDLNILGIPTTLLVDRDGRELGRAVGPAEWDSPEFTALIERIVVASPMPRGGSDGLERPSVSESLPSWPHVNVNQLAIDRRLTL